MDVHYPYPIFLNLSDRQCIVVGGGNVALRKIMGLLEAGATVTVVAEKFDPLIMDLEKEGKIKLIKRHFKPQDIENAFVVFAATDDNAVNVEIAEIAREQGTLVNTVDNPGHCDFFSSAVMKRGPLRIAVSTSGLCPGIAYRIRRELEELYDESYADFIQNAGVMRHYILHCENITENQKNNAMKWLYNEETFNLFVNSGKEKVWEELEKIISS